MVDLFLDAAEEATFELIVEIGLPLVTLALMALVLWVSCICGMSAQVALLTTFISGAIFLRVSRKVIESYASR